MNKKLSLLTLSASRISQWKGISQSLSSNAKKTALYDYHREHGGKMVDFAGYQMAVQYGKVSISASHRHVRENAGLFDVSHMLQTKFYGKDRVSFLEKIIVGDLQNLAESFGMLSLYTTEDGGIIDDLICSKLVGKEDAIYVVSNAGCRDKDLLHVKEKLRLFQQEGWDVKMEIMDNHGLVALQGPSASSILQDLTSEELSKIPFMRSFRTSIAGIDCQVTRCGYTGEDGFEISVPNKQIEGLCKLLISQSNGVLQLAGLGARDSLRLEAGLCLYGNDIDETTTPIEAGLSWTIGKRRKELRDFPGAQVILNQLKEKPKLKRIGLVSEGPPVRSGCEVYDMEGNKVGKVTSGCPSPTLGKNISMAYVSTPLSKIGTELKVQVRSKKVSATVTKMPFVKCNYYIPK